MFRNFGLLSFGEEAEEDETETNYFVQKNSSKSKSVHDAIDDPRLSKQAIQIDKRKESDVGIEENPNDSDDEAKVKERTDRVRDKLKTSSKSSKAEKRPAEPKSEPMDEPKSDSDSDEFENELERERKRKRQKQA